MNAEALHSPQAMGTVSLKLNTDCQQKEGLKFKEGQVKAQQIVRSNKQLRGSLGARERHADT